MALIGSIAFLISLFTFNLVVLNKMDKIQEVLEIFPDQSHFSKFKQENASKTIKDFNRKIQVMVTTQTIGFLILFMLGIRLGVLLTCLATSTGIEIKFYEKTNSVFEESTKEHSGIAEQEPTKI